MKIQKILKVNEMHYKIKDLVTLDYYVFITENENSFTSNYFIDKSNLLWVYMNEKQGTIIDTKSPGPAGIYAKWEKGVINFYDFQHIKVAYFIVTNEFIDMLNKGVEELKSYNGPREF